MKPYRNVTIAALALSALALNVFLNQHAEAAAFTETGPLNATRLFHSATLLPNGKVLVAGGGDEFYALSGAELYDPSNGTWTTTGSLVTTNRFYHSATLLRNGKVLVAGGWDGFNTLASAELYDPATEVWNQTGSLSTPRYMNTMTLLTNGQILVAGGEAAGPANSTTTGLASAELYDPATGRWSPIASMTTNRSYHQATLLPNGKVLVAGGRPDVAHGSASSAEIYDPDAGTWTPTGAMTTNRAGFTATLLANGKVLVAGGRRQNQFHSTAELYDPAAGTWNATGAMNGPRAFHRATLLPDGQVLVAGGYASLELSLNTAELYDPATGTWTNTGPMNQEREDFTATLLPDGKVLIAAGQYYVPPPGDYFIGLSSAELYDSARAPITLVNSLKQPGGAFQFAFTGAPLGTNTVLSTTDPASPLADWSALAVVPEFAPGLYLFSDPQATNGLQRFYRVRSP